MHFHVPPSQVAVVKGQWVDQTPCLLPPPPARACGRACSWVWGNMRGNAKLYGGGPLDARVGGNVLGTRCFGVVEAMRGLAGSFLPQFAGQGWECIPCVRSTALRPLACDWTPAVLHPVEHAKAASAVKIKFHLPSLLRPDELCCVTRRCVVQVFQRGV